MITDDLRVGTQQMAQAVAGVEESRLQIEGAEETALSLSRLNERWFLLSDLRLSAHVVLDHLLVGPSGIYAITSVHLHGKDVEVTQAGLRTGSTWEPVLQNAFLATLTAQQLLRSKLGGLDVVPVLSVVCAADLQVSATAQCEVVRSDELTRYVSQREPMMMGDRIREIVEVARRLDTFDRGEVDEQAAQEYREMAGAPGCQRGYVPARRQNWMTKTALDRHGRGVGEAGRTYALSAFWLGLGAILLLGVTAFPALACGFEVLRAHRGGKLVVLALVGMGSALLALAFWLGITAYLFTELTTSLLS